MEWLDSIWMIEMSNEDYVKQGRSDKLLGREGYKAGYKKRGRGEGSLTGEGAEIFSQGARLQG